MRWSRAPLWRVAGTAAATLTWLVAGAAAAPPASTVRLDTTAAPVLAGAHVGTISQAVRRFGKPDKAAAVAGTSPSCRVSWKRYRLEIRFSTAEAGSCTPDVLGAWKQVTVRGSRWRTRLGLHIGDGAAKLTSLYPAARRLDFLGLGALRELETGGPPCDGGPPLALAARVAGGTVTALLVVHVPACG